nr:unnamed protein product [Callosobruchus analis]
MIPLRSWVVLGYLLRTTVYCVPNHRDVLIKWDPVDPASVRGTFRGYLVYAIPPDVTSTAIQFFPYSRNFITVAVRNDKYVGPRSQAVSFEAPQTEPNMPQLFEHYVLGNHSVLSNGALQRSPMAS